MITIHTEKKSWQRLLLITSDKLVGKLQNERHSQLK